MLSIKRKLSSKSGASMLLAMVFLMFCLFIGGSVLAAATANGSRVEHLKNDQQDYLSQRSAMLLMADMLTGTDGKELQVTITDVTMSKTEADGSKTVTSHIVTFTSPSIAAGETPSLLQKMLFEVVVAKEGTGTIKCNSLGISEPSASSADQLLSGTISASAKPDGASEAVDILAINYAVDPLDYTLKMDFGTDGTMVLTMDGSRSEGTSKKVIIGSLETETITKVVRWSNPVIEKRGA